MMACDGMNKLLGSTLRTRKAGSVKSSGRFYLGAVVETTPWSSGCFDLPENARRSYVSVDGALGLGLGLAAVAKMPMST